MLRWKNSLRMRKLGVIIETKFDRYSTPLTMIHKSLPDHEWFKQSMTKAFFEKCTEQLCCITDNNWVSILTRNGYYKKAQLKDQLPEVASILSRKIPKCARKIIKHPIKMRGRKLVRALFRDCSALAKFSGKHKLFVRLCCPVW